MDKVDGDQNFEAQPAKLPCTCMAREFHATPVKKGTAYQVLD
jgi:hypothetical protein